MAKLSRKIDHYAEKMKIHEYNFKVKIPNYVHYNEETWSMEINPSFAIQTTKQMRKAHQKLDYYRWAKQKMEEKSLHLLNDSENLIFASSEKPL